VCVCVCAYACVCERERERKRECVFSHVLRTAHGLQSTPKNERGVKKNSAHAAKMLGKK